MAQSTFGANATQFIDGVDTDFAPAEAWNLGVEFLGETKTVLRRCLGGFNVLGPAMSGRPLIAADTVTTAELILNVASVAGPSAWAARVERNGRADWDYTAANWDRYRIGANWSTGGGDVATPPSAVTFTSPALTGEQIITGMAAFVTDAIANRGGIVLVRLKADDESDDIGSHSCAYTATLSSSLRPRLRVTYVAPSPTPIDNPKHAAMHGEAGGRPARADRPSPNEAPSQPHRPEVPTAQLSVIPNEVRNLAADASGSNIPRLNHSSQLNQLHS